MSWKTTTLISTHLVFMAVKAENWPRPFCSYKLSSNSSYFLLYLLPYCFVKVSEKVTKTCLVERVLIKYGAFA